MVYFLIQFLMMNFPTLCGLLVTTPQTPALTDGFLGEQFSLEKFDIPNSSVWQSPIGKIVRLILQVLISQL